MKSYRNALAALVLAFVFSTSAFAAEGIIHTEKTPPPPPPTQAVQGAMWTGITDPAPETETETDTLTEVTFGLLQTLLQTLL